ncbi:hypothetical protein SCLCIDRAFT_81617, partial [Scleroderma citrinum Foug A]
LASSKVWQVTSSHHLHARSIRPVQQILGPKKIAEHAVAVRERRNARFNAMTVEEKQALMALCERQSKTVGDSTANFGDDNPDFEAFDDILSGTHPLDISHAGREFQEMARQVL